MTRIVLDIVNVFVKSGRIVDETNVILQDLSIKDQSYRISVEELINQMNGVDPLIIQDTIGSELGEFVTLNEIIEKLG